MSTRDFATWTYYSIRLTLFFNCIFSLLVFTSTFSYSGMSSHEPRADVKNVINSREGSLNIWRWTFKRLDGRHNLSRFPARVTVRASTVVRAKCWHSHVHFSLNFTTLGHYEQSNLSHCSVNSFFVYSTYTLFLIGFLSIVKLVFNDPGWRIQCLWDWNFIRLVYC